MTKLPLSINDPYYNALQRARRSKWRAERSDRALIADEAVKRGEIHPDHRDRLEHKLDFGEVMRLNNGMWVCSTCGGNCGQCGMTDFLGNVGFSFDRIVAGINPVGEKPLDQEARVSLRERISWAFRSLFGGAK